MLVILVSFAFGFGLALSRIGLPPMVGFLLAGFAYNMAGLLPPEGLDFIAGLGVTLLLFSIGLKLDVKGLLKGEIWASASYHLFFSTALYFGLLWLGHSWIDTPLLEISWTTLLLLAFALSFSSTVFVVKVLEEKGDMSAFYGKIAIGILVMQDIFAVVFLSISEGKIPSVWAFGVLLLPFLRPLLFKLMDMAGHGELLMLCGLFIALGVGAEGFHLVGLKPDLGALVVGVLIASHPKASEISKALFGFKELMLVGFFLSIGMSGLPTPEMLLVAVALCALLPLKSGLYHIIISFFGLRARSTMLATLSLTNYSEFGLIVAGIAVHQGLLPTEWLLIMAITVSLSFALAAPLNTYSEKLYQFTSPFLKRLERSKVHPNDAPIDIGNARVMVIGMGRVGSGAYDELAPWYDNEAVGIEHAPHRVDFHRQNGRNVMVGDATDTDFWTKIRHNSPPELVVLAMPSHHGNVYAAHQLRNLNFHCKVAAIAKFPEEVEELQSLGVVVFNMYEQAGAGLARHAIMNGIANCEWKPTP